MKVCWQEVATPGVYVEARPIAQSLLGVASSSRVIPRGDAEVGGGGNAGLPVSNPHSIPSLDAVKMMWTPSSTLIFCPSHQRPLQPELIYGLGKIWKANDRVGTVLEAGMKCFPPRSFPF